MIFKKHGPEFGSFSRKRFQFRIPWFSSEGIQDWFIKPISGLPRAARRFPESRQIFQFFWKGFRRPLPDIPHRVSGFPAGLAFGFSPHFSHSNSSPRPMRRAGRPRSGSPGAPSQRFLPRSEIYLFSSVYPSCESWIPRLDPLPPPFIPLLPQDSAWGAFRSFGPSLKSRNTGLFSTCPRCSLGFKK